MKNKTNYNISESIETLTTHGLPNLMRTKNKLLKLIWLVLIIIASLTSFYYINQSIQEYLEFNVNTQVRYEPFDRFELPHFLICDKNQFSTEDSINYMNNNLSLKFKFSDDYTFDLKATLKYINKHILFNDLSLEERQKITKPIRDLLAGGSINFNLIDNSDFKWYFNEIYGNCYLHKFNFTRHFDPYSQLQSSGMPPLPICWIDVYLGQSKEFENVTNEKGIYLSILDDRRASNPYNKLDNLIEISPGMETNIQIKKSVFYKEPEPYSACQVNEQNEKSFLNKNIYYTRIKNLDLNYSQSFCMEICKFYYYDNKFNCNFIDNSIGLDLDILKPNKKFCIKNYSNKTINHTIIDQAKNKSLDVKIESECKKECPLECNIVKYDSFVTTSALSPYIISGIKQSAKRLGTKIYNDSALSLAKEIARINIFFDSLNYVEYKEMASMSTFDLVSNFGGILGLFLGMSLLSFIEFFEIFVKLALIGIDKLNRKK